MKKVQTLRWCVLIGLLVASVSLPAQEPDFARVPGVIVAYSPASSGKYLGSPSICILPDGSYVASHDFFGPQSTEHQRAVSRVYRSTDKGKTWSRIAEINGQFWSNLFVHRNVLYLMGTDKHYGNAIIRRSTDGGVTWTEPTDGQHGLLREGQYHCAPVPIVEHNGRLWRAMEDAMGPVRKWGKMFGSFVFSIPVDADLLDNRNWLSSNALRYDSTYLNGQFGGWLEGNAVQTPAGEVVNILRADYRLNGEEKAAVISLSSDGKTASFDPASGFINFPGGCKKFTIRYDPKTKKYWSLTNYVPADLKGPNPERIRNTQALCSSSDLRTWEVHTVVLQHPDKAKHGFQYLDWQFDGKDLVILSRTAFEDGVGGAHNQHDANFMTFHRIKNFRKYSKDLVASFH